MAEIICLQHFSRDWCELIELTARIKTFTLIYLKQLPAYTTKLHIQRLYNAVWMLRSARNEGQWKLLIALLTKKTTRVVEDSLCSGGIDKKTTTNELKQ